MFMLMTWTSSKLLKSFQKLLSVWRKNLKWKILVRQNFVLAFKLNIWKKKIFIHQSTYTEKVLKWFYMDKSQSLSTPMVVRSLYINKDPFRPQEKDEELLGDETPHLSAIGALMYLANNTRPDICFTVSLLARFS